MKPLSSHAPERRLAPTRAGRAPHWAAAVAFVCAFAGCDNGSAQITKPVVLGMTDTTPPSYSDQELTMYTVQRPVQLPVRAPTGVEMATLGAKVDPYPRTPFLLNDDERIEVRFTISNLDDKQHSVELLLDPWNEFVRYKGTGVTVVSDDQTTPNLSGWDKFYIVPPKGRIIGTLTPDDMHDLAVKLATVENIIASTPPPQPGMMGGMNPTNGLINRVWNIQNRTNTGDPLFTPYIPHVIAGLTGFDLGLRTYEPANVAIEITVDITDLNGNRIVQPGKTDPIIEMPGTVLQPPGAR